MLSDMVPERSAHWLRGREAKQTETGINVPDEVGEVADKIIKMAALEQEGKFKTDHENDVLTHSLGNPEHPGRVEFILIIFSNARTCTCRVYTYHFSNAHSSRSCTGHLIQVDQERWIRTGVGTNLQVTTPIQGTDEGLEFFHDLEFFNDLYSLDLSFFQTLAHADYFKEEAKQDFARMMSEILSNPPPEVL